MSFSSDIKKKYNLSSLRPAAGQTYADYIRDKYGISPGRIAERAETLTTGYDQSKYISEQIRHTEFTSAARSRVEDRFHSQPFERIEPTSFEQPQSMFTPTREAAQPGFIPSIKPGSMYTPTRPDKPSPLEPPTVNQQKSSFLSGGRAVFGSFGLGVVESLKNTFLPKFPDLDPERKAKDEEVIRNFIQENKDAIQARADRLTGFTKAVSPVAVPAIRSAEQIEPAASRGIERMRTQIDVGSESSAVQAASSISESLGALGVAFIPGLGKILMANNIYMSSLNESFAESERRGEVPNTDAMLIKAIGTSAIYTGLHALFGPIAKKIQPATGWGLSYEFLNKFIPKGETLNTIWKASKFLNTGALFGAQRAFAGFTAGLLTKYTTNPDDPLFSFGGDPDAIITPESLANDFATGFLFYSVGSFVKGIYGKYKKPGSSTNATSNGKVPTKKWFTGVKTEREMKLRYRELAKKYHPNYNPKLKGSQRTSDEWQQILDEYSYYYPKFTATNEAIKMAQNKPVGTVKKGDLMLIQSALRSDLSEIPNVTAIVNTAAEYTAQGETTENPISLPASDSNPATDSFSPITTTSSIPAVQETARAPVTDTPPVNINLSNADDYIDQNVQEVDFNERENLAGDRRSGSIVSYNNNPVLAKYGYWEDLGSKSWLKENTKADLKNNEPDEDGYYEHFKKLTAEMGSSKDKRPLINPQAILDNTEGGVMGEHLKAGTEKEQARIKRIEDSIKEKGYAEDGDEFPISIYVDSSGKGYVAEGNHRLRAAANVGIDKVPVMIKYWQSGPLAKGFWNPDNISESTTDITETISTPAASNVVLEASEVSDATAGQQAEIGQAQPSTEKKAAKPREPSSNIIQQSDERVEKMDEKLTEHVGTEAFDKRNSGPKPEIVKGDPAAAALKTAAKDNRGNKHVKIIPETVRRAYGFGKSDKRPERIFTETPEDQAVKQSLDDAKNSWRPKPKTISDRLGEAKQFVVETFMRGAIPELDYKHGDLRFQLIRMQKRQPIVANLAEHHSLAIYKPVPSEYSDDLMYAIILPDLKEDIDRGLYDDKNLPFNFESKQQVMNKLEDIRLLVDDPSDPTIKNALSRRKLQYEGIKDTYIAKAIDSIGMDAKPLFNRNEYYKHIIIHYLKEMQESKAFRKAATNAFKLREGSSSDYVADTELADFLAFQSMYSDILRFDLMKRVKKYDVSSKAKMDAKGNLIIPEGHMLLRASDIGFKFPSELIKENQIEITKRWLKDNGIGLDTKFGKQKLKEAKAAQAQLTWIVPEDVYRAVTRVLAPAPDRSKIEKLAMMPMATFKQFALRFPTRVVPYQLRNMTGDIEQFSVLLAGVDKAEQLPKIFKYIGEATAGLANIIYKKQYTDDDMYQYVLSGQLYSGHSFQALQADRDIREISIFKKDGSLISTKELASKMTGIMGGIDRFYLFREHILRVAAYKYFKHEILNNKRGLPENDFYYGSIPREIQDIDNIDDRSLKMANDMSVAYDDSPPFVQFASKTASPFLRFAFGNPRRMFREMHNSFYKEPGTSYREGLSYARRAGIAAKVGAFGIWRIGKILAFGGMLSTIFHIWNNTVMKEQEKELPDYAKDRPHLILGQSGDEISYMSGLGSTSQATSLIGITDINADLKKIMNGEVTMEEYVKDMAKWYMSDFVYSSFPLHRTAAEVFLRKKMWPEPSDVRDPWEHAMQTYQLQDIYKAIKGRPFRDGSLTLKEIAFNQVYKGESAYWDIYNMRNDYLVSEGIKPQNHGVNTKPKSMALYYFRTSVRLKDYAAAERYLKEYANLGGTLDGIETSARGMNPMQSMTKEQREGFAQWLSEEEMERYMEGKKYYENYVADIMRIVHNPESVD